MTGVHATEQRFDHAVDDGRAKCLLDGVTDADVGVSIVEGEADGPFVGGARDLGVVEETGGGVWVGRDAHERARGQRLERASRPQHRWKALRVNGIDAELGEQRDDFGPTPERRLGADVDGVPGDHLLAQLAPDAFVRVEHRHLRVRVRRADVPRCDEP